MQKDDKIKIQSLAKAYIQEHTTGGDSQKQAIAKLRDVSEASFIKILQWKPGSRDDVSNEMWRTVGYQVGWRKKNTVFVETLNAQTLMMYYLLAKDYGEMFCVVGLAGWGKTCTAEFFTRSMRGRNVFYLRCKRTLNKKYFLVDMLRAMGKPYEGLNVYDLMQAVVYELGRLENPLFIFDEIDKLPDEILMFFIELYNELRYICGFMLQGQPRFITMIKKGMERGKPGYRELYSRIGRNFIQLVEPSKKELAEIAKENGIAEDEIMEAVNESEGDIRRIDRMYIKKETKSNVERVKEQMKRMRA